jgi:hypothetical protein
MSVRCRGVLHSLIHFGHSSIGDTAEGHLPRLAGEEVVRKAHIPMGWRYCVGGGF